MSDARELLSSFDLEICKCSFDGNVFRVPDHVKSFAGHTRVTPARRALVRDFMRNVKKFAPDVSGVGQTPEMDVEMVKVLSKITKKSWNGIGATKFKDTSKEEWLGEWFASRSWYDFQDRYIFLIKLVERLQKYDERGVTFDDAPEGALGWKVAPYNCYCLCTSYLPLTTHTRNRVVTCLELFVALGVGRRSAPPHVAPAFRAAAVLQLGPVPLSPHGRRLFSAAAFSASSATASPPPPRPGLPLAVLLLFRSLEPSLLGGLQRVFSLRVDLFPLRAAHFRHHPHILPLADVRQGLHHVPDDGFALFVPSPRRRRAVLCFVESYPAAAAVAPAPRRVFPRRVHVQNQPAHQTLNFLPEFHNKLRRLRRACSGGDSDLDAALAASRRCRRTSCKLRRSRTACSRCSSPPANSIIASGGTGVLSRT